MSHITCKSACNGKFACIAPFLGDLTITDVEHLLSVYTPQEILPMFPAEHRMTAMLFCNYVLNAVWNFDIPDEQTAASFADGRLNCKSKTALKFFADFIKTNRRTLKTVDLSGNDLSLPDANVVAIVLANHLAEGQLDTLTVARCNASKTWVATVRSRVSGRIVENDLENDQAPPAAQQGN